MTEAGFTVAGEEHAICPVSMIMIITMTMIIIIMIIMTMIMIMIVWSQVMLWDEQLNQEMAKLMLAEGVLVIPLRFLIYLSRVLPDRVAKCEIFYTDQNLITISQLCFRNESKILKWSNIGPILVQHWNPKPLQQLPSGGSGEGAHPGPDQRGALRPSKIMKLLKKIKFSLKPSKIMKLK